MPILVNTRHEAFAQARAAGLTIDAAYVAAGYRQHRGNAARLSANESVQRRVQELQEETAKRAGVEASDALQEIARIAFSNIRDLFGDDGQLLPIDTLPYSVAAAIQSIKVTSKRVAGSNSGEVVITTEVRFWDKNAALEKLAKHLRLYDEKDAENGNPVAALLAAIMGAAKPLPVAD